MRKPNLDQATSLRAVNTIEHSAREQAKLIEDMLDVSRIVTGKLLLDFQPIQLAGVVEAAVETVRPTADDKEIQIEMAIDSGAGLIQGDASRVQQALSNLLSNAVKFTSSGGLVQIRLERVASHIEVIVTDTGEGIEPEFLPHVFDRFRQADSSSSRRHGGLGLGLAIVRHLVELHGGTVHADSPGKGQGAKFTLRFPVSTTGRVR